MAGAEEEAGDHFVEAKNLGLDEECFSDALPLWHNEVSMLLEGRINELAQEAAASNDSGAGMVDSDMLAKTLDICRKLDCFATTHTGTADLAKEALNRDGRMTIFEQTLINNLLINDVDECLELIPSLRAKYNTDELREELRLTLEQVDTYQSGQTVTSSVGGLQITRPEDIDHHMFADTDEEQSKAALKSSISQSDFLSHDMDRVVKREVIADDIKPMLMADSSLNNPQSIYTEAANTAKSVISQPTIKKESVDLTLDDNSST